MCAAIEAGVGRPDLAVAVGVVCAAAVGADRLLRLRRCWQGCQQESRYGYKKLIHTSSSRDCFELLQNVCDRSGRGECYKKHCPLQQHGVHSAAANRDAAYADSSLALIEEKELPLKSSG
jgi:hypothetical protein